MLHATTKMREKEGLALHTHTWIFNLKFEIFLSYIISQERNPLRACVLFSLARSLSLSLFSFERMYESHIRRRIMKELMMKA